MNKLDGVGAWSVVLRVTFGEMGKLFGASVLPFGFRISMQEVTVLKAASGCFI